MHSEFVGCLNAGVSQGRICSDNFTCCHTEIQVAEQTFHLTQSQYTDTGPTSPSPDPITPGAWQGGHLSANFKVTSMTRLRKNAVANGNRTLDLPLSRYTGFALTTRPPRRRELRTARQPALQPASTPTIFSAPARAVPSSGKKAEFGHAGERRSRVLLLQSETVEPKHSAFRLSLSLSPCLENTVAMDTVKLIPDTQIEILMWSFSRSQSRFPNLKFVQSGSKLVVDHTNS